MLWTVDESDSDQESELIHVCSLAAYVLRDHTGEVEESKHHNIVTRLTSGDAGVITCPQELCAG